MSAMFHLSSERRKKKKTLQQSKENWWGRFFSGKVWINWKVGGSIERRWKGKIPTVPEARIIIIVLGESFRNSKVHRGKINIILKALNRRRVESWRAAGRREGGKGGRGSKTDTRRRAAVWEGLERAHSRRTMRTSPYTNDAMQVWPKCNKTPAAACYTQKYIFFPKFSSISIIPRIEQRNVWVFPLPVFDRERS